MMEEKRKSYLKTYLRKRTNMKNNHIDLTDSPATNHHHVTRSKTSIDKEVQNASKKSKPFRNAVITRSKNKPSVNQEDMKTLLSYPPSNSGHRTVVSLVASDIETLSPNQLLNDQLMDFWLQYIYRERLTEADRSRSHIFSSYFYNSLKMGSSKKNMGHKESIHKNWMKNVNIFDKDFLFVPISLRSHWFCAVLCFPFLNINPSLNGDTPIKKVKLESCEAASSNGEESRPFQLPKKPCILLFDSMSKYLKDSSQVYRTLWKFLTTEIARQSNNQNVINFNAATMPACLTQVPQQTNKTDCGLFVLKFFEAFFTHPIDSFEFPLAPMKDWFDVGDVKGMRQEIYKKILDITGTHFPDNLSYVPSLIYDDDENCVSLDDDDEEAKDKQEEEGEEEDDVSNKDNVDKIDNNNDSEGIKDNNNDSEGTTDNNNDSEGTTEDEEEPTTEESS